MRPHLVGYYDWFPLCERRDRKSQQHILRQHFFVCQNLIYTYYYYICFIFYFFGYIFKLPCAFICLTFPLSSGFTLHVYVLKWRNLWPLHDYKHTYVYVCVCFNILLCAYLFPIPLLLVVMCLFWTDLLCLWVHATNGHRRGFKLVYIFFCEFIALIKSKYC